VAEVPARPAYKRIVVKGGRLVAATFLSDVSQAGAFQYLMREKIDIGEIASDLLDGGREGITFLDRLHRKAVRGELDWPPSMDLIEKYRKDHRHTRWGKAKSGKQPS
jgi:hypothetical protein